MGRRKKRRNPYGLQRFSCRSVGQWYGSISTALPWVPTASQFTPCQQPSDHTILPKATAPLSVLTKKSPGRCWGRRKDSPSAGQQMQRSRAACCLFSLCLTAALWIVLLVRLWTMRPSQETQPNIYLHRFNLKQLEEG